MLSEAETRDRLVRLEQMSGHELREEWRRLVRSPPPNLSRDLLVRALAYRVQEIAEGGLPKATLRRLSGLADVTASGRRVELAPILKPGARLVREWHGRTYTVAVTPEGFEHEGRVYRSLSQIAREITGTRWSGPRFFAPLRRGSGARGSPDG